jgi:hypothetical protein
MLIMKNDQILEKALQRIITQIGPGIAQKYGFQFTINIHAY